MSTDKYIDEESFWDDYDEGGVFHECGEITSDKTGQLIIYTGWFRWSDGSVRNTQEVK